MPLLGKYTVAGVDVWVWKVTETLDELLPMVPDECAAYALDNFSSRKRRTEWLAVRAAVAQLFGDGVRIVYDAAGKPLRGWLHQYFAHGRICRGGIFARW